VSGRVITTAGRAAPVKPGSAKREAIARVRAVLRDPKASDAQVDDALEALTEISRSTED
jgi:hypothetical protein